MAETSKGPGKKLEKVAAWIALERRTNCRDCKRTFRVGPWDSPEVKKLKEKGPPCHTCTPNVLRGNEDAFRVFQRCGDQWIYTRRGQRIAIKIEAVESVMRIANVKDQLDCLDRVKFIASRIIENDARARE